jgi:hypothetical protein
MIEYSSSKVPTSVHTTSKQSNALNKCSQPWAFVWFRNKRRENKKKKRTIKRKRLFENKGEERYKGKKRKEENPTSTCVV